METLLGPPDIEQHELRYVLGPQGEFSAPMLIVDLRAGRARSLAGSALTVDGREDYDSGSWSDAGPAQRQRMARDLFKSSGWVGDTREQIIARLGPPDEEPRSLFYSTRETTAWDSNERALVFDLDSMERAGRVLEVR